MSNATYVLGTIEYLMVEIEVETPGVTFVPADWTAKMYLANTATSVVIDDLTAGDWEVAALETVGTKHYAKILVGDDIDPGVGVYNAFVKLTPDSGTGEYPILKAAGTVTVVGE